MKKYLLNQPTAKKTSQTLPIPGREAEMVQNNAGGFTFKADSWQRLERFLILGTEGGTYYVSEKDFTKQNVDNVRACILWALIPRCQHFFVSSLACPVKA